MHAQHAGRADKQTSGRHARVDGGSTAGDGNLLVVRQPAVGRGRGNALLNPQLTGLALQLARRSDGSGETGSGDMGHLRTALSGVGR